MPARVLPVLRAAHVAAARRCSRGRHAAHCAGAVQRGQWVQLLAGAHCVRGKCSVGQLLLMGLLLLLLLLSLMGLLLRAAAAMINILACAAWLCPRPPAHLY